jgi:glycosyltransferase involved in cell wall biosynthesis
MKKINVLQFICPAGLFGAEMWILALAGHLNPKDVHCHLAVSHESDDQNLEIVDRYYAFGLPAHKIKMQGRFDPFGIYKLVRLIQQEKIDIIHTHGYKSDILGLAAARIAGIKAVATPHGFENAKDLKLQLFIAMGCMAFRFFDKVAPLSEALEQDIRRVGVNSRKIRLVKNGVDLKEIEIESDSGERFFPLDDGVKRIGYVGQMAYRKNVDDILTTFDLLWKEHKNIRLYLVGEGPMRLELEDRAASLASSVSIKFLGYRSDRLQIVKELDLFTMTSSLEGIPRCMMEAMAMGVPVVAYDIPGVDQLIVHGKTGFMADFGKVDELKRYWEKILFNDEVSRTLAGAGRNFVRKKFSGARMAREYTQLYTKMIQ